MTIKEAQELYKEIRKDKDALYKLKQKARWEQVGLLAVIIDYGDPRKWND